ncbi:MAG: signal peptidase II [Proteobacteria bacterium]|nr:signal peptidase II [Pseudomonadota bacterium]
MKFIERKSLLFFFLIAISALILDQSSKLASTFYLLKHEELDNSRIYQGSRYAVFTLGEDSQSDSGAQKSMALSFQFNYVRNHGAAYGLLRNLPENIRLQVFHVGTLLGCAAFTLLGLTTLININGRARFGLILMVSGALGNFLDRLRLGYVVDMLDLKFHNNQFRFYPPVFNVADIFVVVGLILLIFSIVIETKSVEKESFE